MVRERFRVDYTLAGLDVLLHRIGWSVQVPARRTAERDEAAIAAWREGPATFRRFDLAAIPVCDPTCDGSPQEEAVAGPAALAHGTCMARPLHLGRSIFNLLESVVVRM